MKSFLFALAVALVSVAPLSAQFVKGTYNGLFFATTGVELQSSGSFSLTTTTSGAFSGKLQLGGSRVSFKGSFDPTGKTNLTVTPKNSNPLTVQLQLENTDRITGSVSDGTWTAPLAGDRAVFDGKSAIAPQAGRYTLILPGNYGSTSSPAGDSYGTLTVDKAGRIALSGSLADGTKLSQSATLSDTKQWPFYVSLYGNQGLILGWMSFSDDPGEELEGSVTWIKPIGSKAKYYPAGFTNVINAAGSPYQPPPKGSAMLNLISGEIIFTGGNLSQPITNQFLLDANNHARSFSSNKLSLTFTPASGAFKGSVTDPATGKAVPFGGVVQQGLEMGAGYLSGTNQSGEVQFGPLPGDIVDFKTLGGSFDPEVYFNTTPDSFHWSWSDGSTSTDYPIATRKLGGKSARHQYLTAFPAGVVTSINIGFDGSDGGESTPLTNRPPQNVGGVYFPYPLTSLRFFASSYSPMASGLDFTGFTSLEAIECFHCENLGHVSVANLPALRRLCLEDCNLQDLDLTGDPALADVRAALNVFTNVVVAGGTGPNIRHWCTRNNAFITQNFQDIMGNFFNLEELWIWENNQSGALTVVSTKLTSVKADHNHYESANLSGQVNLATCWLFDNSLTNLVLTGCVSLQDLDAHNNQLTTPVLDALLADLDALGTTNLLSVNLTNNAGFPSMIGYGHYQSLTNRGVTVFIDLP